MPDPPRSGGGARTAQPAAGLEAGGGLVDVAMSEASEADVAIREGLAAWTGGDLDGLERVLDPAVTLPAVQPGPWDCQEREQGKSFLRLRSEQRNGEGSREVQVQRINESTLLVSGACTDDAVATLVKLARAKCSRCSRSRQSPLIQTRRLPWQQFVPATSPRWCRSSPSTQTSPARRCRAIEAELCCTSRRTGPGTYPTALRSSLP